MIQNNKIKKPNIGIITNPVGKAGSVPLSNLINVIHPLSEIMHVITGNEGMNLIQKNDPCILFFDVRYIEKNNILLKIINHICMEFKMSIKIIRSAKSISIWIFFLDSHSLILPVLAAKMQKKKVIFALSASIKNSAKAHKNFLLKIFVYAEVITFKLSNQIVVYAPNIIKNWDLEKYRDKISIADVHVLDFKIFNIYKKLNERDNVVGYIGRLSEEKGALNFVKAIPELSKGINGVKFIIGGDGHLRGEIEKFLSDNSFKSKAELLGWIPRGELPGHFNLLKLLVLPSYSEGLPNIMLEAMACGTPVLATRVGAIPDIIRDRETGFLMEDNSPECIAANIVRALGYPDLEGVVLRARALVEREYTIERAVEGWRKVLGDVGDEKR